MAIARDIVRSHLLSDFGKEGLKIFRYIAHHSKNLPLKELEESAIFLKWCGTEEDVKVALDIFFSIASDENIPLLMREGSIMPLLNTAKNNSASKTRVARIIKNNMGKTGEREYIRLLLHSRPDLLKILIEEKLM